MPNDTTPATGSSTGVSSGSTTGVSAGASGGNDASTLGQAAAALAAAATSLSENMAKFSSLTENVQKALDNLSNQVSVGSTKNVDSTRIADTSVEEHVTGVKGSEAITDHVVAGLQDWGSIGPEGARRSRLLYDKMVGDVIAHDNVVRSIMARSLSNSTETDNLVGKQAVRHADLQITEQLMAQEPEIADLTANGAMALGSVVNDLVAAASTLKAVAQQLATPTATPGATTAAVRA